MLGYLVPISARHNGNVVAWPHPCCATRNAFRQHCTVFSIGINWHSEHFAPLHAVLLSISLSLSPNLSLSLSLTLVHIGWCSLLSGLLYRSTLITSQVTTQATAGLWQEASRFSACNSTIANSELTPSS